MSAPGAVGRFFRHSAIYAVGNALNRVGAFLLLPLYTRYLSVAEYGGLELYYAISAVVSSLLSVGIAHATLRFYFEYENERDRHAVVSTNLIASLLISGTGVLLIGGIAGPIAQLAMGSRPSGLGLTLVLATLVLELSSQVGLAYMRAREESVLFVAVSIGKLLVQCAANIVLLAHFDAGIEGVLGGNLLAVALGWLVTSWHAMRQCGWRFERAKLMPVLHYSLPFLYVSIIAAVSSNFDRFVIGRMLSLEALGVYALATKFAKLISDLLGEPFSRAYGAFRFSVMKRDDAAQIQASILRYVSAALAVISLVLVYFTGPVLQWVATPAYAGAAQLMPLLVVAASLQILTYILQTGILVKKTTGELVTITLMRSAVLFALGFPLIWSFGLQGACALQLVDAAYGAWLTHRKAQPHFPVHYDLRRLAALGGLLALFIVTGMFLPAHGWAAVGAKAVLLGVFAAVVLSTQLATNGEREAVRRLARGRLSPRSAA